MILVNISIRGKNTILFGRLSCRANDKNLKIENIWDYAVQKVHGLGNKYDMR
jgi:hypothetical protein